MPAESWGRFKCLNGCTGIDDKKALRDRSAISSDVHKYISFEIVDVIGNIVQPIGPALQLDSMKILIPPTMCFIRWSNLTAKGRSNLLMMEFMI